MSGDNEGGEKDDDSIVPEGYVQPDIATPEDDNMNVEMAKSPDEIEHDVEKIDEDRNLVKLDDDDTETQSSGVDTTTRTEKTEEPDEPETGNVKGSIDRNWDGIDIPDENVDERDVKVAMEDLLDSKDDNAYYIGMKKEGKTAFFGSEIDSGDDLFNSIFARYAALEKRSDESKREAAKRIISQLPVSPPETTTQETEKSKGRMKDSLSAVEVCSLIISYDVTPDDSVMDLIDEIEKEGEVSLDRAEE